MGVISIFRVMGKHFRVLPVQFLKIGKLQVNKLSQKYPLYSSHVTREVKVENELEIVDLKLKILFCFIFV